jgi:cytosine/adenosine deaminase-related metal-dependent hydrolase
MQIFQKQYNNQKQYAVASGEYETLEAFTVHSYRVVSNGGSVKIKVGTDTEITLVDGDCPAVAFGALNSRDIKITAVGAALVIYTTY